MFTGIIEEKGAIKRLTNDDSHVQFTIYAPTILNDVQEGDSIAVNGICLTATQLTAQSFTADVMNETLNRTSLKDLSVSDEVNVERAMQVSDRFSGHIVSGHIDGVGEITSIQKDGLSYWYRVKTPSHILKYIIEKGSVALDGISLTVAAVDEQSFSVSVIPHTFESTNFKSKNVGDIVNIENDLFAKYIEKFVGPNISQTVERGEE